MKKNVVYSFLGTTKDFLGGEGEDRWNQYRPNVALCQQSNFRVDRLHLLIQKKFLEKAEALIPDIQKISPQTEIVREIYECQDPWDFQKMYSVLFDLTEKQQFDPENENYFVHLSTGTHTAQICLFLLTESRHFPAQLLQTNQLKDANGKLSPTGNIICINLDLSTYDHLAARFQKKTDDALSFLKSGIKTKNAAFNALIAQIEKVAVVSTDPLLITGPTGSGKSKLARKIHELRKERLSLTGKFIEVNCATLRADSAMAALFGHTKGAFTGAVSARSGYLKEADGGILFLDEIGELGLDEQAMLLHAIEEKTFFPIGSDHPVSSSFQLICGTNRDLQLRIEEGLFREDLFARINLWTFELPSLVQRPEDIAPNIEYEIRRFAEKTGKHISFNEAAHARFLGFARSPEALWCGNFRDLNAAMTRMGTLAEGGRITEEIVEEEIARLTRLWRSGCAKNPGSQENFCWKQWTDRFPKLAELDRFDQIQLQDVLRVCTSASSISEAGRTLFAQSRKNKKTANDADRLRKYLKKFDLTWDDAAGK